MTLETMMLEIRENLGEDAENFWKDDHVIRRINEAQRRFCAAEDWQWLTTVAEPVELESGTATLDLTPNVSITRTFNFILADGDDLYIPQRVLPAEGLRLRTTLTSAAIPEYFYVYQVTEGTYQVRFLATPDRDFAVEYSYIRRPVELVEAADESEVPEEYVEAVIAWATGTLWMKELNSTTKAQEQFAIYSQVVEDARRDQKKLGLGRRLRWGGEDHRTEKHLSAHYGTSTYGLRLPKNL